MSKPLYRRAIRVWGKQRQIQKAIEEFAELTVELSKYLTYPEKRDKARVKLVDEIGDATIMLGQIREMFKELNQEIEERIEYKKTRIEHWLDKEES